MSSQDTRRGLALVHAGHRASAAPGLGVPELARRVTDCHRLQTPTDLALLDSSLLGWEQARTLITGTARAGR